MNKNKKLTYDYIRDIIVEIRCAKRDGLLEYEEQLYQKLPNLIKNRHTSKPNRFGLV